MNTLKIKQLHTEHIETLYNFEKDNKKYFEQTCTPRSETYNEFATFSSIVETHIAENEQGEHLMFLVFNEEVLVGRINVVDFEVEEPYGLTAMIGYRFGKEHTGKGYATQAIKLVKQYLKKNNLCHRLYAGTAIDNYGSQIALIKNHFHFLNLVDNSEGMYGPGDIYVELACEL